MAMMSEMSLHQARDPQRSRISAAIDSTSAPRIEAILAFLFHGWLQPQAALVLWPCVSFHNTTSLPQPTRRSFLLLPTFVLSLSFAHFRFAFAIIF